jgi:hypothetical protein
MEIQRVAVVLQRYPYTEEEKRLQSAMTGRDE